MVNTPEPQSLGEALYPLMRRSNIERSLSPGKVGALRHLTESGASTVSELATAVRVSPQAISLAVRELEGLSYVVRVPDTADRRRTWIEITDSGRQKLAEELSAGLGWIDAAAAQLSEEEQAILCAAVPVLRKLHGGATRA